MESDTKQTTTAHAFFCVRAADAAIAERLAAEAWVAGATGIEERESTEAVDLFIYAPSTAMTEVRAAIEALGVADAIGAVIGVPETDWSEQWKVGLVAIDVSPRLRIRPSFVETPLAAGQFELVIDPGQAFGTGGHASTLLALEWVDALVDTLPPQPSVLDIGTGTGVLSLAAIGLADANAVAFDLDPLATAAARENAANNGLSRRLRIFTGSLDALGDARFDLVVANLLKNEMLSLVRGMAAATKPGGWTVVSGLLASDEAEVSPLFEAEGFTPAGARRGADTSGEVWAALLMRR